MTSVHLLASSSVQLIFVVVSLFHVQNCSAVRAAIECSSDLQIHVYMVRGDFEVSVQAFVRPDIVKLGPRPVDSACSSLCLL